MYSAYNTMHEILSLEFAMPALITGCSVCPVAFYKCLMWAGLRPMPLNSFIFMIASAMLRVGVYLN